MTPTEFAALRDAVGAAFLTVDAFRLALPDMVRDWADDNMPQRPEKAVFITRVLEYAWNNKHAATVLGSLWRRTEHRGLLDLIEGTPSFRDQHVRMIERAAKSLCVDRNRFLINRSHLRDQVRAFLTPREQPCRLLVIPSSKELGKSYSELLFRDLASKLGLRYRLIDCLRERDPVVVAHDIANLLGLYDPALTAQIRNSSKPGSNLVTWIEGRLPVALAPARTWIVFDNVEPPKPDPAVASIVRELADKAASPGAFHSVYVTLIDSSFKKRRSFGGLPSPVLHDQPVSMLTELDVAKYLQDWAVLGGRLLDGNAALAGATDMFDKLTLPLDRSGIETLEELVGEWLEGEGLI